jgi:nucleoside-diphosphate-sugar epimerase
MRVVVFGAEGWTGRAVLANLASQHQVRCAVYSPESWTEWQDVDGVWQGEDVEYGDIADFDVVHRATAGMDAIIHLAVHFSYRSDVPVEQDTKSFLINLKGLWNVLESARQRGIERVVHVGSCMTVHPQGVFFSADTRSVEGSLYGICKRLQEEMCRQFHDAFGMRTIVLRPDYIVDSRAGIGRGREQLGGGYRNGWVCRHDLAEACRLAVESKTIDHDIFHIVGTPEARLSCNVERSETILGLQYKGDLDRYR